MKKITLLFIALTFLAIDNYAQNKFQRIYGGTGGDEAFAMNYTSDGGFVMVGRTTSFGISKEDVYVIKVDLEGNIIWSKAFGGTSNSNIEYGYGIQETSDKGFIVVGSHQPNGVGNANYYFLKLDAAGNRVWSKTFSGSASQIAKSVVEMPDSSYLAVGQTASYGSGGEDAYLVKMSRTGNLSFAKAIGGTLYEDALSIIKTMDGGYAFVGKTHSYGAGQADVYLVKLDNAANVSWVKAYGGTTHDYGYNLIQTTDSGFAITGYTMSYTAGLRDILLMKTDKTGTFEWGKAYGGASNDEGFSVAQFANGNYIITGFTSSFGSGGKDISILKTDASGNLLTFRALGGASNESAVTASIKQGNLWIFGQASSYGAGSIDWVLAKADTSDLSIGCNDLLITTATVTDAAFATNSPSPAAVSGSSILTVSPTASTPSTVTSNQCFTCAVPAPVADFSFTTNMETVMFTESSQNSPASFSWNFGNGQTSTQQNPVYAYTAVGSYNVCLTVTNCTGTNQVCKNVSITSVGLNDIKNNSGIIIYPNPINDRFNILLPDFAKNVEVKIYTPEGKILLQKDYSNTNEIDLASLSLLKGIYFVQIITDNGISTHKIIK